MPPLGSPRLPSPPLRTRVRTVLRWGKRNLRRALRRRAPTWSAVAPGPAGTMLADGRLSLTADSVGAARQAAARLDLATPVTAVELTISQWRAPMPGWSGRLGAVPGLVSHAVQLPTAGRGPATVGAAVSPPVPAQGLLDAVLAVLEPVRGLPSALTAEIVVDGNRPAWVPAAAGTCSIHSGDPAGPASAVAPPQLPPTHGPARPRRLAQSDLQLVANMPAGAPAGTVARYSPYGLVQPSERVLVDVASANPIGRGTAGPDLPTVALALTTSPTGEVTWRVAQGRRTVVAGRSGDPLTEAQRAALARLGRLTHAGTDADCAAAPHAAVVAQLAATGVVVHTPDLPAPTAALLSPELVAVLGAPLPAAKADPVEEEIRSVRQRRAALRGHDAGLTETSPALTSGPPTVTALVVSRRPQFVARVLGDLAAQTYPRLQVVVAMHGVDLDADARGALDDLALPAESLLLPARLNLGEALAEATRAARGTLVTKVDDDDRYGAEHVWDLVLAHRYSGATLVGKPGEFVHLTTHDVTVRRRMPSETYTRIVAGPTLLLARGDLEALGGWRPVPRAVDSALIDRVLKAGGLTYATHGFGFIYTRHGDGHTWDPGTSYFVQDPARQWTGLPAYSEFVPMARGEH